MSERVVVTGLGVVTPIGIGAEAFQSGLREGRSGVGPITAFACEGFETRIAAEIEDSAFDPAEFVHPRKLLKLMSRAARFGIAAAAMARRDAGLGVDDVDPRRLGVSLGAGGMGPVDLDMLQGQTDAMLEAARRTGLAGFDPPSFAQVFRERTNPISLLRGLPNGVAAHIAIQANARGPNATLATACTAGTQAIGDAMHVLRRGDADVMLAGGSDAMINPTGVLGFGMLGTLSVCNDSPLRTPRPFDLHRDGFVIGEGAAVAVLETESFARARGARILAELAGYASTCDAYRLTDERPDASGAADTIRRCLQDASMTPSDVGYINAHGTGTRLNDATETRAIRTVFGDLAANLAVSSTKSMTGHLLAAAGAVEMAACVLGLNAGFLPPTINYETPDPECDLDFVPNLARAQRFDAALSNSFGFGGQNACLLIRRY